MKMQDDEFTPQQRMEIIFRQIDTVRDGQASFEEFIEGARYDPEVCKLADPTVHLPWSTMIVHNTNSYILIELVQSVSNETMYQ